MKNVINLLCSLLILAQPIHAQIVKSTGLVSIQANTFVQSGSRYTFSDTTYLAQDGIPFKPLLALNGLAQLDTNQKHVLKLIGTVSVYAKVGNGPFQKIWNKTGNDTMLLSLTALLSDTGIALPGLEYIYTSGAAVSVTRINLRKATDSVMVNSAIGVGGILYLPETGGAITRNVSLPNDLIIRDTGNVLSSFRTAVVASFFIRGFGYQSNQLNFSYNENTKQFSLDGGIIYRIDSNDIAGVLGDSSNPGMVYTNGMISKLQFTATDTFRLFGQKFHPKQFTIAMNNIDSVYLMYGTLGIEMKGSVIEITLGDSLNPGAVGKRNQLTHFAASITDTFTFRNFRISPQQFTLAYDTLGAKGRFYAYGNVNIYLNPDSAGTTDSIYMQLGTATQPGLEIKNGELEEMAFSLTTVFQLKGLTLEPIAAGFRYETTTDVFEIYGSLHTTVDSVSYRLNAGNITNPGIQFSQGKLMRLQVSIDDTLTIRGFKVKPNQLTFSYDTMANNSFMIFGSATVVLKGDSAGLHDTISVSLGNETNPGMAIRGGILVHVNLGVGGTFYLKKMAITPDGFTFQYDAGSRLFEAFGKVSITFDSTTYRAQLGNDSLPGILFSQDKLIHLEATITDTFQIKSFQFIAQPLTLSYDTAGNNTFSLYGSARILAAQDTISLLLGNKTDPGISVQNGKLKQLHAGINADFKLNQIYIKAEQLTFDYNADSAQFEMYGSTRIAFNTDTISVELGNETTPGVAFKNNKLARLQAGITDTMRIKTLAIIPQGLTFVYQSGNQFAAFGSVTCLLETDTVRGVLGSNTNPGLVIENGSLTHLRIGIINSNFSLKNIGFQTDSLFMEYNKQESRYEAYGDVSITFDSNTCRVGLGSSQSPGLIFANGTLQHLQLSVTDTIRIRSLIFEPQALTFKYDKAAAEYELYGTANTIVQTDTIQLLLGTDSLPGMRIKNGKLEDISIGITTSFNLKSIKIHPDNLTLFYKKSARQFGIYGNLAISFDSNAIDMEMGNAQFPGLVFNTTNGDIEYINMTTTDTFKLYGLVLQPTKLNFTYSRATARYSMYGSLLAALRSDTVIVSLGDSTQPGFIYQNGVLQQLSLGITDSITLYQLRMKSKGLTLVYERSKKQYSMYGDVTLAFSNEKIEATMGTANKPGIVITNSEVTDINIGVSGQLSIGGVSFNANQVTFVYDKQNNYYEMYGTLSFTLENETISAQLGTAEFPGFTIRNGTLYEFNIGISSNIKIGGLTVSTQDVGMYYEQAANQKKYVLRGTVMVQELWSIAVSLGVPGNPTKGLEIIVDQHGKTTVDVTDFLIEAKHVNFGGVTFNDIRVRYDKLDNGFSIGGELDVVFPPGFEVGGKLAFTEQNGKFVLDTIALKYDAGNTEGIEIGETGVFITHMEGEVDRVPGTGLDYKFKGDVVVVAGGKITIANTSYAMLRIEGKAEADKNHLFLDNNIQVAAYNVNNKWEGLYGSGEVSVDINWTKGEYTVKGSLVYYSMVEFKTEAYYHTNGTMGAMGEVNLKVPDVIPIIGGSTLAGIDGAVRYAKHDLNNSMAAGWTTVNLEVKTVTIGAEYNFGTHRIRKIGSSDIQNMQTAIQSDNNATQRTDFFVVKDHVKAISLKIKMADPSQSGEFVTMLIAGGLLNNATMHLWTPQPGQQGMIDLGKHLLGGTYNPGQPYRSPDYVFYYDTVNVNGIVLHFTGPATGHDEPLPVGQYTLITRMPVDVPPYTIEVQAHYMSPQANTRPTYNKQTREVRISYDAQVFVNDSARIHIYEADSLNKQGKYIGTSYLGNTGTEGAQKFKGEFIYVPELDSAIILHDSLHKPLQKEALVREKTVYVYAVIEDGVNEPVITKMEHVTIIPETTVMLEVAEQQVIADTLKAAKAKVKFDIQVAYANYKDIEGFEFSVYYDFDNIGYNGFAIPELSRLKIEDLERSDSLLSFVIPNLNVFGNSANLYFYVVGKGPRSGVIQSQYTHAVHFAAPFVVKASYAQGPDKRDINGMKVWLDMNANGRFDNGIDLVKLSDHFGEAAFFVGYGSYTVGLLPDSNQQDANPQFGWTRTVDYQTNNPVFIWFVIQPPPLHLHVSYSAVSKNQTQMLWALLGYPQSRNYFFVDINGNKLWEPNEPRQFIDNSGELSLITNQTHARLIYVDVLANNTALSATDRKKLACTKASGIIGGEAQGISQNAHQFELIIDSRDADSDNHIDIQITLRHDNF